MNNLKELSELAWQGELDTKFEHHPVHTHYEGSTELEENLLGIKGIGGMYVVDTKDGLVMLDAGSMLDVESAYTQIREWRPKEKLDSVIFTHHHVDHVFAVKKFDEEAEELKINNPQEVVQIHLNTSRSLRKEYHVKDFQIGNPDYQLTTDLETEESWRLLKSMLFTGKFTPLKCKT